MNIGNCDNANTGEMFEIAEGEELKCPKCGSDMIVEVKKTPVGKIAGIIAAAVIIIGGGIGAFLALGGSSKPEKIVLDRQEITLIVGQRDLLKPAAEPEGVKATFNFKSANKNVDVTAGGEITAMKIGDATITVKCEENPNLRATCKVNVIEDTTKVEQPVPEEPQQVEEPQEPVKEEPKAKPEEKKGGNSGGSTTTKPAGKNPSWGRYEGPRDSNGLPNGNGILYITRSTTINGEAAQAGERIEGVFRNGYVNMGTWYKKDGNAVVVKGIKVV
jgi:ssDNA-binding Zn-finger/Zn-ribbon topoisomerase 1